MDKPWWESGVFLAVGAIAAFVVAILTAVMQSGRTLQIAVWSIAVAFLWVSATLCYRSRERKQIPVDGCAMNFSIARATPDDLLWIANLEKSYFDDDAISLTVLQDWHTANPNGFQIVCDDEGNRIGHLDVLPVKEEAFVPFIAGKIRESELPSKALFTPAERELVRDLYVESVIVEGDDKVTHEVAVTVLLNSIDAILSLLGNPGSLRYVYGLGATRAGSEFMKEKGFDLVTEAHVRVDKHPLYRIRYSSLRKRLRQKRR